VVLGGKYSTLDLNRVKGQADLIYFDREFYLCVVVEAPENTSLTPEGYLSVDLGLVNLAADRDGNIYSGERCEKTRKQYGGLKSRLQSVGTKSASKHLIKVRRRNRGSR
jgi:transposase